MSRKPLAPLTIRLTAEKHLELSALASARGIPLADLVREQLELVGPLFDALTALRNDVSLLPRGQGRPGAASADTESAGEAATAREPTNVDLEILMLLRGVAGPQRLREVRAELARQGYDFWMGKVD